MERNLVIALLLYFLVVMAWMRWQESRYGDELPPEGQGPAPTAESAPAPAAPGSPTPVQPAPQARTAQVPPPVRDQEPEEVVAIDTSLYRALLTSRGAGLRHWELTEFQDRSGGEPVNVVLTTLPGQRGAALYTPFVELGLGDLREASYRVERHGPLSVSFTREHDGVRIRKTYEFQDGRYDFRLRIEVENLSRETLSPSFDVVWPLEVQESTDFADHGLIALQGDSVEREMLQAFGTPGFFSSGPRPRGASTGTSTGRAPRAATSWRRSCPSCRARRWPPSCPRSRARSRSRRSATGRSRSGPASR